MADYSALEVQQGIGQFEHAARTDGIFPGVSTRMPNGVAIGVLSAAMRSGLSAVQIKEVIAQRFGSDGGLLTKLLQRYEGDDWDIDLWHLQPSGIYKVCTDLCRASKPSWRYDRDAAKLELAGEAV